MLTTTSSGWRIAGAICAALTILHITIWTMTGLIGGNWDRPWWLWFSLPAGIALATWYAFGEARRRGVL